MTEITLNDQSELNLATGVIYAEAEDQPLDGKFAVACVIRNRVLNPGWWGKDWRSVLLKPLQFSCLNHDNPTGRARVEKACWPFKMHHDVNWRECRMVAFGMLNDCFGDFTGGANHYYNPSIVKRHPVWAINRTPSCKVGDHWFFKI
jgi:spore germination cell wall hydrolase CwlJ-like protein